MKFFIIVIGWIFFGIVCSKIASIKNRNARYWFILGLFFGLVGLIIIYFLNPLKKKNIYSPNVINQISVSKSLPNDNNYWYYLDNNKNQIGPVSVKKIFDNYFEGKISDTTYVWNDTMKDWSLLKDLPIFSETVL
jgi:hypothetical protein